MKVLIYGAGSIGNHLAQASRRMGWEVTVTDVSGDALERMRNTIYPTRYGAWDDEIRLLSDPDDVKEGEYDVIMIGTPPDHHFNLSLKALNYRPKLLHIEKPLFKPGDDLKTFRHELFGSDTLVTVGYDHAVAPSFQTLLDYLKRGEFGEVLSIDGATREHWEGIFKAHPWLDGPHDSYLGFTGRGGGAACEHSHALHLVLTVVHTSKWGDLEVDVDLDMVEGPKGEKYDRLASFVIKSHSGKVARVVQDVLTKPTEKYVRVQCDKAVLTWRVESGIDVLTVDKLNGEQLTQRFPKSRPDDFYYLMQHYQALLDDPSLYQTSPVRVDTGLQVMEIIQSGL